MCCKNIQVLYKVATEVSGFTLSSYCYLLAYTSSETCDKRAGFTVLLSSPLLIANKLQKFVAIRSVLPSKLFESLCRRRFPLLKWPPHSSDITFSVFSLWGYAKANVYAPPPSPANTKNITRTTVVTISEPMLASVSDVLRYRLEVCCTFSINWQQLYYIYS